jgi:hypothetical protein
MFQKILIDQRADESDRLVAAELAGDFTVINDDLADTLLAVVGSADEPEQLRAKAASNPVLIGEPGVGKDALVHGLAQRIADGVVPARRCAACRAALLTAVREFRVASGEPVFHDGTLFFGFCGI